MLVELKHAIELLLIGNITVQTYYDSYCVAKGFDCALLRENLIQFAQTNIV